MSTVLHDADGPYAVPALEKGMRILEDLASSPDPLSIIELASRQGRNRNEIYRMISCLETLGYITRESATKRYGLSLKLFQLATGHPPLERLIAVAQEPLKVLVENIHESCHLCVWDGSDLAVVAQVCGTERIRITFQLGARFDPLETCSGMLLLSELPQEQREPILEASGTWKSFNQTKQQAVLARLSQSRDNRLWEEDSRLRPGVRDIAVALGAPDVIHATIAVPHLTHGTNVASAKEIKQHLIDAASDIEARLGINT